VDTDFTKQSTRSALAVISTPIGGYATVYGVISNMIGGYDFPYPPRIFGGPFFLMEAYGFVIPHDLGEEQALCFRRELRRFIVFLENKVY
jgi:hypothetical protein